MIDFIKKLFKPSKYEIYLRSKYHGLTKRERMKWRSPKEKPIKEWDMLLWGCSDPFGLKYQYRMLLFYQDGVFYSGTTRADQPLHRIEITKWRYRNE